MGQLTQPTASQHCMNQSLQERINTELSMHYIARRYNGQVRYHSKVLTCNQKTDG